MTDVTPYLADAAQARLEDWGPLDEATGEEMTTSGLTLWKDGEAGAQAGPQHALHPAMDSGIHRVRGLCPCDGIGDPAGK